MTQIWSGDRVFAVTPIAAGPCVVSQVRTKEKDSYSALQLAYGKRQEKNIKKPQRGHFKASGAQPSFVTEFRLEDVSGIKVGDVISAGTFQAGDIVAVSGVSKGRGFQGVVKRHHFAGGRKTHGNKDQERMPGSIGSKGPARVFKGTRMGGRMGGELVTVSNLEILSVDEANNIIFVKGAVPGALNSFVSIKGPGELKLNLLAMPTLEAAQETVKDDSAGQTPVAENSAGKTDELRAGQENDSTLEATLPEAKAKQEEAAKPEEVKSEESKVEAVVFKDKQSKEENPADKEPKKEASQAPAEKN